MCDTKPDPKATEQRQREIGLRYIQLFPERLSEKVYATIRQVLWMVLSALFFKKFERMIQDVCDVMFVIAKGKQPK